MMYMQDGVSMDTVFGDGSAQEGGWMGKLFGAGKRLLTGESMFTTVFVNEGQGKSAWPLPPPLAGQNRAGAPARTRRRAAGAKDAFCAPPRACRWASPSASAGRASLFGGEGFIPQNWKATAMCFCMPAARWWKKQLKAGEVLRVDTGCVVAFQPSVDFDIEYVGKLKSALFGGEGLFFATLTGPGTSGCNRCRSRGWPTGF